MKHSFGGVVIAPDGRVLLRAPADRSHGQLWTFAKGKRKEVEQPEDAAIREVLEETGIHARILARIPGVFAGTKSLSKYFLMAPLYDTRQFDGETRRVRWVNREQARVLIALTEKTGRRRRDLRVLEAAFDLFESIAEQTVPVPGVCEPESWVAAEPVQP